VADDQFDATDPAAIANAERDAKRHAREDADALRALMHTKAGRGFLYRLLDRCHIYSTTFSPGQPDLTAFQLGEENVGKWLMTEAQNASVDLYVQMIKDQRDEAQRLEKVREAEARRRDEQDKPPTAEEMMAPLPPPAGYPGGPPLEKPNKGK